MGPELTQRKSSRDEHKEADSVLTSASQSPASERHYTIAEVGEMWNLSKDTVRRIFQNEPGVLVLGDTSPRRRKRPYKTLRIPASVAQRVHERCSLVSY
jgi:hypothetical protein